MAKLININAPTIEVKNVGIFVDKIQSPGIQICRVDWRNAGDDNCFIFFDDKQTVQIVESEYLPTNTCLEIEVENLNSLHALLNKNGIDYIDEDETSFFIENIYFKAKETSTPHVIEFEFNGNKYTIDKNSSVIAKQSGRILLPDGRALKVEKWTDTIPPQPCDFTIFEIAQASLVTEKSKGHIFDLGND